ncbi:hypothetical protein C8F04DRAFT_1272590 [Mycena alexandri]|uniref:Uncharacterized protein n=1 Tax=Mycena alexandri TaxID=1745969 RepID=A0AAD6SA20_9AGAR|nr:hypothetical protein C8F04DRAFT_1272590 [Mycena alexandri]
MALNLCRDLVLHIPVWKMDDASKADEFDEDGDKMPALVPLDDDEESGNTFIFPTYISIDWSFMLPWRPYRDSSLQKGERYLHLDDTFRMLRQSRLRLSVSLTYSTTCQYLCKCNCHKKQVRAKL